MLDDSTPDAVRELITLLADQSSWELDGRAYESDKGVVVYLPEVDDEHPDTVIWTVEQRT